MAIALRNLICSDRFLLPKFSGYAISIRGSMWPPMFKDPIAQKKELAQLEEGDTLKELAFVPIKAAPSDLTSSVFYDRLINKFTNLTMLCGRKSIARKIVENTLEKIKRAQLIKYHCASDEEKPNIECNPRKIFHIAVENCKPLMDLERIKRGGIAYRVPVPLSSAKSEFLALKWIIEVGRVNERNHMGFSDLVTRELLDAYKNEGRVVKRKQDLHKQCEANKAYAHYRWR